MRKITQEEATKKVFERCKEMNYELLKPFIYKNNKTKLNLKCNKDDYEWLIIYDNFINRKSGCIKCSNVYSPTQKEANEKVLSRCKEMNYELLKPFIYKNQKTNIHLKCKKDNYEWISNYQNFTDSKRGCARCSHNNKLTQEEANENVLTKCKEMNYTLAEPFIYIGAGKTKLHIKCNIDGHCWTPIYNNLINKKYGCPKCNNISKGERIIFSILNKKNIFYNTQYKFDDCVDKYSLKFDFYLPDYNMCIEYDGIQHYEIINFFGGEKEFQNRQKRDNIKTQYCKDNNIKLLRIPYTDYNIIEQIIFNTILQY